MDLIDLTDTNEGDITSDDDSVVLPSMHRVTRLVGEGMLPALDVTTQVLKIDWLSPKRGLEADSEFSTLVNHIS